MSKSNNVNPGQYKVAGRDRMGEPLGQAKDKERLTKAQHSTGARKKAPKRSR